LDRWIFTPILFGLALLSACAGSDRRVLRLATTTSTYDTGLLDEIIPDFEEQVDARVDINVQDCYTVGTDSDFQRKLPS